MKILTLLIQISIIVVSICAAESSQVQVPKTEHVKRIPEIASKENRHEEYYKSVIQVHEKYARILENTNNQLSLWVNPYGIMVGVLGVLFTLLTIIFAVILLRQGKEHRQILDNAITNSQSAIDKVIKQNWDQMTNQKNQIENMLEDYKYRIEEVKEDQRQGMTEFIERLNQQKETLSERMSEVQAEVLNDSGTFSGAFGDQKILHNCSKCKFGYILKVSNKKSLGLPSLGQQEVVAKCPSCNNVDKV